MTGSMGSTDRHEIALAKTLVQTTCDAPWTLFKLRAGKYTATATMVGGAPGMSRKADFTTTGTGPQQEVGIAFDLPPNQ